MSSPIEGYEDIHKNEPYIDAESFNGSDVAHVFMLYVPPQMRGQGVGKRIFCEWLDRLPASVKRVRLKACTLGGSDGLAFWKKLGFTEAFFGNLHHEIENTLVLGVNGYSNPVIERIQAEVNRDRHWIEELEDVHHLRNNPQVLTIKSAEHTDFNH